VSLYIAANVDAARSVPFKAFVLDVSGNEGPNVVGMLESLMKASNAHQYFDLAPEPTILIVSVGEYDGAWWDRVDTV